VRILLDNSCLGFLRVDLEQQLKVSLVKINHLLLLTQQDPLAVSPLNGLDGLFVDRFSFALFAAH
jgi:hypothetical protein